MQSIYLSPEQSQLLANQAATLDIEQPPAQLDFPAELLAVKEQVLEEIGTAYTWESRNDQKSHLWGDNGMPITKLTFSNSVHGMGNKFGWVRAVFPHVPCLFMYRDVGEVLVASLTKVTILLPKIQPTSIGAFFADASIEETQSMDYGSSGICVILYAPWWVQSK